MPPFADDLWFYADIYSAGQNGNSLWEAACATIKNHYLHDNARLSNIIFTLFLLLPGWVGNLAATAAFGAAVVLSYKVVGAYGRGNVGFTTAASMIVLWIFALPWYDSLYQACYQFNYLISTALGIWAMCLALLPSGNRGGISVVVALLSGVMAGGWHEGFGVPVMAGVIGLLIFCKEFRNKRNYCLLLGLAVGSIWIFSSPAALGRAGVSGSVLSHSVVVLALHPAFLLLCVIVALILIFAPKWRQSLLSPPCIALGISAVVSLAIHMASVRAPRAGWWCEFASVVIIGYLVNTRVTRPGRIIGGAIGALLVLGLVRLGVCDVYAWRYRSQYDILVNDYKASHNGTVYLDFTPEYASPLIAWMAPSFNVYYDRYQRWMFAKCYGTEEKMPVVIPCGLTHIRPDDGRLLDGNIKARQSGNFYFCTRNDLKAVIGDGVAREGEFKASIKTGPVTMDSVRVFYFLFENSEKEVMVLLLPWRIFPVSPIFRIEGMWI